MSTQFDTTNEQAPYQQAPYQQAPYQQAPRQQARPVPVPHLDRGHRRGRGGGPGRAGRSPVGGALQRRPRHHHRPVGLDVRPGRPRQPGHPHQPGHPGHPVHPVTPVQPSAAVMQLQRELGQLNYYEGPVDGVMGPQTIAAIQDLQRQAGLPQTGQMNAGTQAALANYLAHGNNQMGGNS